MRQICKSFPGVKALQNVDFTLRKGEIHALMGENGAGKSTLIKVLTGVYSRDAGTVNIEGVEGDVAIRSPQQLCFDSIEEPDFMRTASMDLFTQFRRLYGELCDNTESCQKCTSNWMGVWHPGRQYVTSCDFGALISADMFRDLAEEELQAELDYLDASIFHLDGPGALKNLDILLEQKKLRGVHWVYGAGQPTAAHWLDVMHRIQAAGKAVHIDAYPSDVPVLLKELRPQGLFINLVGGTLAEARELFEKVEGK